ncbi:hypothetical protein NDU88_002686 [Pleurodeles waltl]|uniref:Uncharacterized protein n=1 Tax=Pleurodeles waltl TaxID=8319 RepID=A0AAV7T2K5_PLEWA|nr:hypothetical protein NDU88_002686 [Pleurodeles waltl]
MELRGEDEDISDDLQVFACTMLDEKGCIDEEEWKDAVKQDQVLQELIGCLGNGWIKNEMCDEVKMQKEMFQELS